MIIDCEIRFILVVACCRNMYHNWRWKSLSILYSPFIKWFLNMSMDLSALIALGLLEVTNWYLISTVVLNFFNTADYSSSIKCNHGLIPQILKSVVNSVKDHFFFSSLLFSLLLSGLDYNNIHIWSRCIYFLFLMWWGSIRIIRVILPFLHYTWVYVYAEN